MKAQYRILATMMTLMLVASVSRAEEDIEAVEQSAVEDSNHAAWLPAVKEKYGLTDEQVKAMQEKGVKPNQMAVIAQLAKTSGRSIDEVTAMRTEQKMGWGAIAKQLNVHPKEIGHSISSLRKDFKENKGSDRADRRANARELKAERKAARVEAKETRVKKDKPEKRH